MTNLIIMMIILMMMHYYDDDHYHDDDHITIHHDPSYPSRSTMIHQDGPWSIKHGT